MDLAHDLKRSGKSRVSNGGRSTSFPELRRFYAAVPVLGVLGLGAIGLLLGVGPVLLTLAGLSLAAAIFLLWTSLLAVSEEIDPRIEDALTLMESSVEDERKQSVLRALKDLDYEKAVGKLAEDDYQRLRSRYRAEARALLSASAGVEDVELERANRALEERLRELGEERPEAPAQGDPAADPDQEPRQAGPPDSAPDVPDASPLVSAHATRVCAACETQNDADARFCKGCGAALEPAGGEV